MFGNITDKFFCLLLGIFAVFVMVLKNSEGDFVERFVDVPLKPSIEKIMRTKCNGQVVEVAVPADYANEMTSRDAQQVVVDQTVAGVNEAADRVLAADNELSRERYRENNEKDHLRKELKKAKDKLKVQERYIENMNHNASQSGGAHAVPPAGGPSRAHAVPPAGGAPRAHAVPPSGGAPKAHAGPHAAPPAGGAPKAPAGPHAGALPHHGTTQLEMDESHSPLERFEHENKGFHTVPGHMESTLSPNQFAGATQVSKSVTNNMPANKHMQGTLPKYGTSIEPFVEYADANEAAPAQPSSTDAQPIIYDRLVFKPAKSRKAGQGDMIRGDLPIVPCPQVSQTAANPVSDLQNGALNVLFGQPADILSSVQTTELSQASSGQEQFTGQQVTQSPTGGIAIRGFA